MANAVIFIIWHFFCWSTFEKQNWLILKLAFFFFSGTFSISHEACKKRCMEPPSYPGRRAKCPIKETIKPGKSPVSESMIGFDSICMTCTLFGWAAYALQLNHGDSKLTSVLLFGSIPTFLNHNLVLESELCLWKACLELRSCSIKYPFRNKI